MDFRYTEEEERFRQRLNGFLDRELIPEIAEENAEHKGVGAKGREFARKLADNGFLGMGWPKEHGGQGLSFTYEYILSEELGKRWGAVYPLLIGYTMAGPIILHHGSEEMKREFIPQILKAEKEFGLGYTEPQAGSDLAALEIRAVEDGDYYIMNGQKMFNTESHYADYHWLAARTDPDVPRHRGISLFVVDQRSPGITIRPLWTMWGGRTNEVFYDDVRVPKNRLVGEKNRGFYYMMEALDSERNMLVEPSRLYHLRDELIQYVKETRRGGRTLADDPIIRQKLAQMTIELEVARALTAHSRWMESKGLPIPYQATMSKVVASEARYRFLEAGMQILGHYGPLAEDSKWVRLEGRLEWNYRASFFNIIGGGTNEICRNIIAQRGLGLPRG